MRRVSCRHDGCAAVKARGKRTPRARMRTARHLCNHKPAFALLSPACGVKSEFPFSECDREEGATPYRLDHPRVPGARARGFRFLSPRPHPFHNPRCYLHFITVQRAVRCNFFLCRVLTSVSLHCGNPHEPHKPEEKEQTLLWPTRTCRSREVDNHPFSPPDFPSVFLWCRLPCTKRILLRCSRRDACKGVGPPGRKKRKGRLDCAPRRVCESPCANRGRKETGRGRKEDKPRGAADRSGTDEAQAPLAQTRRPTGGAVKREKKKVSPCRGSTGTRRTVRAVTLSVPGPALRIPVASSTWRVSRSALAPRHAQTCSRSASGQQGSLELSALGLSALACSTAPTARPEVAARDARAHVPPCQASRRLRGQTTKAGPATALRQEVELLVGWVRGVGDPAVRIQETLLRVASVAAAPSPAEAAQVAVIRVGPLRGVVQVAAQVRKVVVVVTLSVLPVAKQGQGLAAASRAQQTLLLARPRRLARRP